jgi:hypothetical protein
MTHNKTAVSLDLSRQENCDAFRTGYHAKPEELKDILWFVKASNGSTGNHIQLVRGDVAAKAGEATAKCTGDCRLKVRFEAYTSTCVFLFQMHMCVCVAIWIKERALKCL